MLTFNAVLRRAGILLAFSIFITANVMAAPFAYITNTESYNVSVIDTSTNTVVATIPVMGLWGGEPWGVAVNPAGTRVYVSDLTGWGGVSVIDTSTNTVVAWIFVGDDPWCVAVNPAGTRVYVTNHVSNTVSVIDPSTNTVVAGIRVGSRSGPIGVAVNPAGTRVYVTNNDYYVSSVSVIDTSTNTVVAGIRVGYYPYGLAVNPAGTRAYVANGGSNTVSVIDTSTNTVVATVPVQSFPYGVAVNPAGTWVYVTNHVSNTVSVIDPSTNTVVATVPVGGGPCGVAVNLAGTRVYAVNYWSGTVSVIDTSTNTVVTTVRVGSRPIAFGNFIGPDLTPVNAPPVALCKDVTVTAGLNWTGDADIDNGSYDPDGDTFTTVQSPAGPYGLGSTIVTLTVTDSKGASSSCNATVTIDDATAPVITPAITGTPGNDGWYTSDVTVSWSVIDEESEVTSVTGGETTVITQDTSGVTLTCEATSDGGTNSVWVTVKRDATAPVINILTPADGDEYIIGEVISADWNASDAMSGVADASAGTINTATAGQKTFTVTAIDVAGNEAVASRNYYVLSGAEAIDRLIAKVKGLNLDRRGTENSLLVKLYAVKASLERDQENTAVNQINAFINEVRAQSGKKVAVSDADDLISRAARIIAVIQ